MNKKSVLAIGLAAGLVLGMGTQAFASDAVKRVSAAVNETFKFVVNGENVNVSDEYDVLVHNNRTYLPVRAVSEMVGADIQWDEDSKTVNITHKQADPEPSEPNEPVTPSKPEYKKFPQIYENTNFRVDAMAYFTDTYGDRLYIKIKNKEEGVLRLNSSATTYEINGVTYDFKKVDAAQWDTRWYTQYIEKDGELEGYLRLPRDLDDFENLTLHIELQYDGKDETHSVEFNLAR